MKFIQQEILNFGGNPFKTTIFGQSAGSASVSAHTYSPVSQGLLKFLNLIKTVSLGLFQQAIQESGTVLTCLEGALGFSGLSYHRAEKLCNYTKEMWNSRNYTALKACLLNMNYSNWLILEPVIYSR